MTRLTDIHQHLLWGLDDGPKDAQGMADMLLQAHQQGIGKVVATVHACPGFKPFDAGLYRERLAEAQWCSQANDLGVEVIPGAEVAWTYHTMTALQHKTVPTLGNTDYVLLELWRDISLAEARNAVKSLTRAGYCPVLAHVERYRCFRWWPHTALKFRAETGALFQLNAGTLLNPSGPVERNFVRVMLRSQGLDAIATDAHGTPERPVNLQAAYQYLLENAGEACAQALTVLPGAWK